jgi:hypothetical protein
MTALASHYSVNVTGVPISATFAPNLQYSTTIGKLGVGTKATTTAMTVAATHVSQSKRLTVNSTRPGSTLSLAIRVGKSSVHPGDTEIVSISAVDKNSSKPIKASVSGNVSSSGLLKKFRGSTDDSGRASYSWKVSTRDTTGKYRVIAQVYSPDYESKSASKTFKVSSLPVATNNSNNSFTSSSSKNRNNISDAAHFNNSKNKVHHQYTSSINSIKNNNNNNNNNSIMPSINSSGSHTKKGNLATSNAAHFNNSKNNKLINPIQRFGVPITHVPFVVP